MQQRRLTSLPATRYENSIVREPLAACPWPSRPSTEPAHRAGHALHRARLLHALCRPAHDDAAWLSCHRRHGCSSAATCTMRSGTIARMACTGSHCGRTHHIPVSAPDVQTSVENRHNGTRRRDSCNARARVTADKLSSEVVGRERGRSGRGQRGHDGRAQLRGT